MPNPFARAGESDCRVSEEAGLRIGDLNLTVGYVRCLGKGSKERLVPLGDEAIEWIRRYLADAGEERPLERGRGPGDITRESLERVAIQAKELCLVSVQRDYAPPPIGLLAKEIQRGRLQPADLDHDLGQPLVPRTIEAVFRLRSHERSLCAYPGAGRK